MVTFPNDRDRFPVLTETRPGQFEAIYDPYQEKVKGHVFSDTVDRGKNRAYLFEAEWHAGKWNATITAGDPNNENLFDDRDNNRRVFRALKGMPIKHRRDLHDYVSRISSHIRNRVLVEGDWLREQFARASISINIAPKYGRLRRIGLVDGWRLEEHMFSNNGKSRTFIYAYLLGVEVTDDDVKHYSEKYIKQHEESLQRRRTLGMF